MYDCGDKYFTERYGLNSYLLLYTVDGSGEIDIGEGRKILSAGQAVVLDCVPKHYYGTVKGERWKFFYCHFQGNMEGFSQVLLRGGQGITPSDRQRFSVLFEQMLGAVRDGGTSCSLLCNDYITQLLTRLAIVCYSPAMDANLRRH